jgi:hypothetical protein
MQAQAVELSTTPENLLRSSSYGVSASGKKVRATAKRRRIPLLFGDKDLKTVCS